MAGLQLISPMVANLCVTSAVGTPSRAEAAAAADEAKKLLLDLAAGNEVHACGVRVQRVEMPGSIDWKRFQSDNPEVADKVEACRKPGSVQTKVLLTKEETK